MWFIATTVIICGYLFFGSLGVVFASIVYFIILFVVKADMYSKLVSSLILSLPISYIGILGKGMSHIFSWYIVFLTAYTFYAIFYIIKNKLMISKKLFGLLLFIFVAIFARNFFCVSINTALIDLIQMFTMLIPVFLCYSIHIQNNGLNTGKLSIEYIDILDQVIFATAVALISQYIFYKFFMIELGYISVFLNRTTFDLLFKGYSVLSIFLGLGIIINTKQLLKQFRIFSLTKILVCIIAIALNTSRTGLFSAFVIVGLMVVIYLSTTKNKQYAVFILVIILSCCIAGVFIFSKYRYDLSNDLLNNNGRFETYFNAIRELTSSLVNFFFGVGLSNQELSFTAPHNFILQSLLSLGIIISVLIFLLVFLLFFLMKHHPYRFLYWHIILSSMFITGFFESTYTTVCCIILIASLMPLKGDKNEKLLFSSDEGRFIGPYS